MPKTLDPLAEARAAVAEAEKNYRETVQRLRTLDARLPELRRKLAAADKALGDARDEAGRAMADDDEQAAMALLDRLRDAEAHRLALAHAVEAAERQRAELARQINDARERVAEARRRLGLALVEREHEALRTALADKHIRRLWHRYGASCRIAGGEPVLDEKELFPLDGALFETAADELLCEVPELSTAPAEPAA